MILESYLGEQLVEMLSNTASYNKEVKNDLILGLDSSGWKKELEEFIPATFMNRLLKERIINLLNIKYCNHYNLMREVKTASANEVENKRFELNPEKLYLLTELKLAYNTIWISLNILIDTTVFLITDDILSALTAGAIVEVVRRFKW